MSTAPLYGQRDVVTLVVTAGPGSHSGPHFIVSAGVRGGRRGSVSGVGTGVRCGCRGQVWAPGSCVRCGLWAQGSDVNGGVRCGHQGPEQTLGSGMGARSGTVWDTQAQWLGHWECAAPGHEVGGRL